MYIPLFVRVLSWYALLCVLSSFTLTRKRERERERAGCFALIVFLVSRYCVPWVGLHYVIVVFPHHTHLLHIKVMAFV